MAVSLYMSEKSEVKDSNAFCDSLILEIPQMHLVIINIYRPPNCPENLFLQTLEHTSSFLRNLESYHQHANDYLVFGDLNFPFYPEKMETLNHIMSMS